MSVHALELYSHYLIQHEMYTIDLYPITGQFSNECQKKQPL